MAALFVANTNAMLPPLLLLPLLPVAFTRAFSLSLSERTIRFITDWISFSCAGFLVLLVQQLLHDIYLAHAFMCV